MLDHSAVCKVFECANTTGRWDKHVNRKCKACGMCMSQWVFDLWINHYLYRIIGFHMPIDSLRSHICIWIQSNHFFFIQTRYQQSWLFFSTNVFLHPCRMVFWAAKREFFDWANRHVPRKNVFERIESTIGKSDLGEKAWCLKTASGSLLVLSNLEESTYRYGPHMDDAFSVS